MKRIFRKRSLWDHAFSWGPVVLLALFLFLIVWGAGV